VRALMLASTALALGIGSSLAQNVVDVPLNANLQNYISSNPAGTIFQLAGGTRGGQQFTPQNGDQFIGAANGSTVFNGNGQSSPMVNGGASNVVISNITTTNFNTPAQVAPI